MAKTTTTSAKNSAAKLKYAYPPAKTTPKGERASWRAKYDRERVEQNDKP